MQGVRVGTLVPIYCEAPATYEHVMLGRARYPVKMIFPWNTSALPRIFDEIFRVYHWGRLYFIGGLPSNHHGCLWQAFSGKLRYLQNFNG